MSNYQPGVCKIGKNEINKRYMIGIIGFVLAIALTVIIVYYQIFMPISLILVFFPLMIGFEGLFQGKMKFCVRFASKSLYNFYGTADEMGKVANELDHHLDMQQAMKIHLYSVFLSILFTAIIFGVAYAPLLLQEKISEGFIRFLF